MALFTLSPCDKWATDLATAFSPAPRARWFVDAVGACRKKLIEVAQLAGRRVLERMAARWF
jgi:hypothetical protein